MRHRLLCVVLPVMLINGVVGCSSKDVSEESKTDSVEVAKKEEDSKIVEYRLNLTNLMNKYASETRKLTEIIKSDKTTGEKAIEYKVASQERNRLTEEIANLETVDRYKESHALLKKAMIASRLSTELIQTGFQTGNAELIRTSAIHSEECSKLIKESNAKMKEADGKDSKLKE